MKINTKFGIGEIVAKEIRKNEELLGDELMEVCSIHVSKSGNVYFCRLPKTMLVVAFEEHELIGDPDYDQEKGCYPEKE